MDILDEARKNINEADREIAKQFEKRMEAVRVVAEYKREHGLPILDKKREEEVIRTNSELIDDPVLRSYYTELITDTIGISKQYQSRILTGMKIAVSGIEGAFAYTAARTAFASGEIKTYENFRAAYKATVSGECDCTVLPIENSYTGEVGQVSDLLFDGPLYISGVCVLPIRQNLLGVAGSTLADITKVVSHAQALSQCAEYIEEHGFAKEQAENTARAAKFVAEEGDVHVAAIASLSAAKAYGLSVLDHDINSSAANETRFALLSRTRGAGHKKFFMMFTTKNETGALAKALNVIASYGFNLLSLRSRPLKSENGQYYFAVEAEGDVNSKNGETMQKMLKTNCKTVKLLGSYDEDITAEED